LTILDNLLTVVASAGGKERAGQPYPHLGELLEGAGGGYAKRGGKLLRGDLVVTRVLREVCQDCRRPYWEKLEIQKGLTITVFSSLSSSGY
jgi:hypothetical protein